MACQEFAVAEALRSLTAEKLKEALQAEGAAAGAAGAAGATSPWPSEFDESREIKVISHSKLTVKHI